MLYWIYRSSRGYISYLNTLVHIQRPLLLLLLLLQLLLSVSVSLAFSGVKIGLGLQKVGFTGQMLFLLPNQQCHN